MEDTIYPIIIDNGTETIKAGFAGEEGPRFVIPSVVSQINDQLEFGNEALNHKYGRFNLHYPVKYGLIKDWDRVEKLWDYIFSSQLRLDPQEYKVVLTEAGLTPKEDREKMAQIMFEKFNVEGLYIGNQGLLSLYFNGYQTGIVCNSGASVTHTIPIKDGLVIQPAVGRVELGGTDLTKYFAKRLAEKGFAFSSPAELDIVKQMKESHCTVAQDFEAEFSKTEDIAYQLPDGQAIRVGNERLQCAEALFKPQELLGRELDSIQDMIIKSIDGCDEDLKSSLYGTVVLSGGNTMFGGIRERLQQELDSKASGVKVIANDNRRFEAFLGASTVCQLSMMEAMWVSQEEYKEHGLSIVHTKCPQ
ncbi:UNKNOWN [Stylonychia lemnae]|uniref:Actin n=1 Tax=Stylonychia lemnae TaxID=5949 RepID=A0A077ZUC4_STYLE|nr:UNKNOWN [Stylonychia lemnae]|eukprot:CDW73472.1 UNKNOWN [Stylonychia lemnae]